MTIDEQTMKRLELLERKMAHLYANLELPPMPDPKDPQREAEIAALERRLAQIKSE